MSKDSFINGRLGILIQVCVWSMFFLSQLSFFHRGDEFNLVQYLMVLVWPLVLMIAFYVNYLLLVPKYYFGERRQVYYVVNLFLIFGLAVFSHLWLMYVHDLFENPHHHHHHVPTLLEHVLFVARDAFNLAVAVGVATSIRLGERWHHAEEARYEAEAARAEAELGSLRSQVNPHFLLNTLNNIYALTAIDTSRAQEAIQQLSQMLRHLLYDNQEALVDLDKEVGFMERYVNLMKIRLSGNVDVTFLYEPPERPVMVTPLIATSLIENAFKHGVSPTEHSFIHIKIAVEGSQVVCDIENSNHPKNEQDRSGHGVGLHQVQRRLDLSYPGNYEWHYGVSEDGKTYRSVIRIDTNPKAQS